MKAELLEDRISIPEGVDVQVDSTTVTVKGAKGELKKLFPNKRFTIKKEGDELILGAAKATKNEKKLLFTFAAHIKNMFRGVIEGHTYKLKICSGHFPMNVSLKGGTFEIKNFIGEAVPRTLTIKEGADVKVDGDQITVTGINKELVAQTAASIEKLTRRPGFDERRFQDGIYIIEKDGKTL